MPDSSELGHDAEIKALGPKVGRKLGRGLRSALPGFSFVDITGAIDADGDGIVFEGKPGLERPIIPRFVVPNNLARKLSRLTKGDAEEIEKQRRAGNSGIEFDEAKLKKLVSELGGRESLIREINGPSMDDAAGEVGDNLQPRSSRAIRETMALTEILSPNYNPDEWDSVAEPLYEKERELLGKILDMGEWTGDQEKRIRDQVESLIKNLMTLRDEWQSIGEVKRTGPLRRQKRVGGYEPHPDAGMSFEELLKKAVINIHDDGTVSVRMPPNPLLRKIVPGDRDYHDTEIPSASKIGEALEMIGSKQDYSQWDWLRSQMADRSDIETNKPQVERRVQAARGYRLSSADAIKTRANEIAEKIFEHYVLPEIMKISDNDDAKTGGLFKDVQTWVHGYLHVMANPKEFAQVAEAMQNKGLQVYPLLRFHDFLGHYTMGNMFDRHGEWGNILAQLQIVRDRDFWNKIRKDIPELADLDDLDRDIFLRGSLLDVATPWFARLQGKRATPNEMSPIEQLIADYDGPIDELVDFLDPPGEVKSSSRSIRSVSLLDVSNEQLVDAGASATEGMAFRVQSLLSRTGDREGRVPDERPNITGRPTPKSSRSSGVPSIKRGDGMIKRDEKGRPVEWNTEKFLSEQSEKRVAWLRSMGFNDDEIEILLGQKIDNVKPSRSSRSAKMRLQLFELFDTEVEPKRGTRRVAALSEMSDAELKNALELYNLRPSRRHQKNNVAKSIPSWFPSRDELVLELNDRGYDVFLTPGTSRRYSDFVHVVSDNPDADDVTIDKRILTPTTKLSDFISSSEDKTGERLFDSGAIKNWDYLVYLSSLQEDELKQLSLEFDEERTKKVGMRRDGVITPREFDEWYRQMTKMRRLLSDELTKRSVASAAEKRKKLTPQDESLVSIADYSFMKKAAPSMASKRSFGLVVDDMLANGYIDEDTFSKLRNYHEVKDYQLNQLADAFSSSLGIDIEADEFDFASLDEGDTLLAKDIFDKFNFELSKSLSSVGLEGYSYDELLSMGIDPDDVDDILDGPINPRALSSRSKRRRRQQAASSSRKPNKKLSPEEVRISQEQKLRSKKVPGKRQKGPSKSEWTESRMSAISDVSSLRSSHSRSLFESALGPKPEVLGRRTSLNGRQISTSFGSDVKRGDVLPDNFDSQLEAQTEPRFLVLGTSRLGDSSTVISSRDLINGVWHTVVLHDLHPIANSLRPANSSRSSRSRRTSIPSVRNEIIGNFERGDDDTIVGNISSLVTRYSDLRDQYIQLESQVDDEGEFTDISRMDQLEEIMSGVEREIMESISSVAFLGEESRNHRISQLGINTAIKRVSSMSDEYLERLGLSKEDRDTVVKVLKQQKSELAKYSGEYKNKERIDKIIDQVNKLMNEDADSSLIFDYIETNELDVGTGTDDAKVVSEAARSIVDYAISSVMRNRDLDDSRNTIIEATAREVGPEDILALPSGSTSSNRSARSSSFGMSLSSNGQNMPVSRVIYPSENSKFSNQGIASIVFDGNRNEIVFLKSNGEVFRYGGITEQGISNFLSPRKSVTASINDLDKSSAYVVRPSGNTRGDVPDLASILERDIERVQVSGKQKNTVDALVRVLKGGDAQELDGIESIDVHKLIASLHERGEKAFANNLTDALTMSPGLRSGRRPAGELVSSYPGPVNDGIRIKLSSDEFGLIREELARLRKKYGYNTRIVSSLESYDGILKSAQNNKDFHEVNISRNDYMNIAEGFASISRLSGANEKGFVGLYPLEMASMSPKSRFDSTEMPSIFANATDGIPNAGAPPFIDASQQRQILDWVKDSQNNNIVRQLSSGPMTSNKWRALAAFRNFSGNRSGRTSGSLARSGDESRTVGKPLASLKPSDYDSMKPLDKLTWLNENISSPTKAKGISPTEARSEAREIIKALEMVDRNISRARDYDDFLLGRSPSNRSAGHPRLDGWDGLSDSSKRIINELSRKRFQKDSTQLNDIEMLDIISSLRPESPRNKKIGASIQDADIDALIGQVVLSADSFIPAYRQRKMQNIDPLNIELPEVSEEGLPRVRKQPARRINRGTPLSEAYSRLQNNSTANTPSRRRSAPASAKEASNERISESLTVSRFARKYADSIDTAYTMMYSDSSHSDALRSVASIFSDVDSSGNIAPRDFTIGDINNAIDGLDAYLSGDAASDISSGNWQLVGGSLSERTKRSLTEHVIRTRALRDRLAELRARYSDDEFIGSEATRPVAIAPSVRRQDSAPSPRARTAPKIEAVEKYLSSRPSRQADVNVPGQSSRSARAGRAEIRAEATQFKELLDSLQVEISKTDDAATKSALTKLKEIMKRQKSGLLNNKRTNAGAVFLTQDELDEIIEALYVALDRQLERGSDKRSELFGFFAELFAKAAMATFIDKTVEPINSRTVKKINEAGKEVDVYLYE